MSKDVASASRGRRGGRGAGSGRGQNWGGPNNNWGGMYNILIVIITIIELYNKMLSYKRLLLLQFTINRSHGVNNYSTNCVLIVCYNFIFIWLVQLDIYKIIK